MAVQSLFLRPGRWAVTVLLLTSGMPALEAGSQLNPTSLQPGHSLEGRCSDGVATHDLNLASGEYIRTWIEPHGHLTAKLIGPGDEAIVAAELGPDCMAPLPLVADQTGPYKLEVICDKRQGPTSYRLHVESKRVAFPGDHETLVVARAYLAAEKVAQGWQEQFRREAIREFERVLALAKEVGDPYLEARVLTRLGDLRRGLGNAPASLKNYLGALALDQDVAIQVDAHLGAARALLRLEERDEALQHVNEALTLSRSSGDEHRLARALTTLGITHYDRGELLRSIDVLRQAHSLWQRLWQKRGESEALLHIGFAYSDLSEEQKALDNHRLALNLASQVGDKRLEALTLVALGNVHSKMGEKQEALNLYYQATPLLEAMGDPYWAASLYTGMGYALEELGDKENALGYYERALEANRTVSSTEGQGFNLLHLGHVHLSMGHPEKALSCFQTALLLFQRLGTARMEAVSLGDIASAHEALGQEMEALDYYARALKLYETTGYRREEANTLNHIGRIEERRGRIETALSHYRRALALSRETDDRFVESQSLLNLARAARASGDLDQARRHAEDALGLVEELRQNVASYSLRASYFASIHELHEFYVDLLMELDRKRPSEAFGALAFDASERARARSFLEMLSDEPADPRVLDPELLEHQKELEQEIRAHAGSWKQHAGRAAGESQTSSSAELSELLAELDRVQAVIRSQSEHHPSLETDTASIAELQEVLDSSTLLLSYFLSENSYVWALTRTDFSVHVLPPQGEIEAQVQRLYRLLADRERKEGETAKEFYRRAHESDEDFWKSALPLSRTLLGPVAGKLEGKRLVIIGDGALHHFPFSALPIPTSADLVDPMPLIAEHEIIRLPSASILVALRTRDLARPEPPKTVAVLADPVFDREDPRVEAPHDKHDKQESDETFSTSASTWALSRALADVRLGEGETIPRLLASRQEAQDILSLVSPQESLVALGFEASRALATSGELTRYQVVHFATHGLLDTEHPELSGIILSLVDQDGEPRDGFLRLHDIENLHLPVNLVVLSACSTGLGKEVKGEGMIGLVRGFMSAGADRVLASYWNVDDEATAELMKRFYRNHFTAGLAPSVALREAQRSMWMEKRWRSPFYWAAFELQGQWQ